MYVIPTTLEFETCLEVFNIILSQIQGCLGEFNKIFNLEFSSFLLALMKLVVGSAIFLSYKIKKFTL